MPNLASYIFKPKHGHTVACGIIDRFCIDFLHYEYEGFYLHWRTPDNVPANVDAYKPGGHRHLPEGYIELSIESEDGNMAAWSETCYDDRRLTAQDLTDSFFALLGDDFWGEVKGEKDYSFEDRDLAEVITELSAPGSRVVSFGSGRTAWIMEAVKGGKDMFRSIDLLDYALTVPIVIGREAQNNQLVLEL